MAKQKKGRQTNMLVVDSALREISDEGDVLEAYAKLIDWEQFRPALRQALNRGDRPQGGRPPFDEVMMFKLLVLKKLNGMSDAQAAFWAKDRLSWWRFLGLENGQRKPDEKTVWKFSNDLTEAGAMDALWETFDGFLAERQLRATQGQIVDSTIVSAPRVHVGDKEREQVKQGVKPQKWTDAKQRQTDVDARYTVKKSPDRRDEEGNVQRGFMVPAHGYKLHVGIGAKDKLIGKVEVTDAASHDSRHLPKLLDKKHRNKKVYADSAYQSEANRREIEKLGKRPFITGKKPRGGKMPKAMAMRNRIIAKTRARVEHVFAELKCRMNLSVRTIGLKRAAFQIRMACLAYNMKRFTHLMGKTAPG